MDQKLVPVACPIGRVIGGQRRSPAEKGRRHQPAGRHVGSPGRTIFASTGQRFEYLDQRFTPRDVS